MRRAAILLWLVAAATARADETHAFVELTTERQSYYVGEPVRITLRLGYDAGFFERASRRIRVPRRSVPLG